MNSAQFFVELRHHFPDEQWSAVFLALRHDAWISEQLAHTGLGRKAIQCLPAQREVWSPANLALLDLGWTEAYPRLCQGLETPVGEEIAARAEEYYQKWIHESVEMQQLGHAAYIALAVLAGRQKHSAERDMARFCTLRPGASAVMACVIGLVSDVQEVIRHWMNASRLAPEFILHALLSNPFAEQEIKEALKTLLMATNFDEAMHLLRQLRTHRPWLLPELANFYTQSSPDRFELTPSIDGGRQREKEPWQALNDWVELYTFAEQPEKSVQILKNGLQSLRGMQGELTARLAETVVKLPSNDQASFEAVHETAQEAWKKACELSPEQADHWVGWAKLCLQERDIEAAKGLMDAWMANQHAQPNARADYLNAELAFLLGDEGKALSWAKAAVEKVEAGESLAEDEAEKLVDLLIRLGEYTLAEQLAEGAIHAHQANLALRKALAEAKLRLGKPHDALVHLYHLMATEEPVSGLPSFSSQMEMREMLALSLQGVKAWQAALDERLRLIHQIEAPKSADWMNLAECALRAGDIEQARQACQHLQELDGEHPYLDYLMGEIHLSQGDYAQALKHLRAVTRQEPTHVAAWLALAKAYQACGQGEQAIESLRKASQANPSSPQVFVALGEAYRELSAWTQAVASLRRAVELDPMPDTRIKLAEALFHLGHFRESLQNIEYVFPQLCSFPSGETTGDEGLKGLDAGLVKLYARGLMALGEHSRALPILEALLQTNAEDAVARMDYLKAALKIGEAQHLRTKVIPRVLAWIEELNQDSMGVGASNLDYAREMRLYLAEAYAAIGDWHSAMQAYRATMGNIDSLAAPEEVRIALGFSRAAMGLGQPEAAIAVLKEVVQPSPEYAPLWRMLSEAYRASNLAREAFQAAREAHSLAPSDPHNLLWFIEQLSALSQMAGLDQQQLEVETLSSLKQAVRLMPQRLDLMAKLCLKLADHGEVSLANELLANINLDAIDVSGVPGEDLANLGQALLRLGQPRQAVTLLKKALESVSHEPRASQNEQSLALLWNALAQAQTQVGEWQAALASAEKALQLIPDQVDAQMIKAEAWISLGNTEEALSLLRHLMRQFQDQTALQMRLAELAYQCGSPIEALQLMEQVIVHSADGSSPDLAQKSRLSAAQLAYSLMQPERALAYLEEEEINRQSAVESFLAPFCLQAEIALQMGNQLNLKDAIRAFLQAHPQNVQLLSIASREAWYQGRKQEAQGRYAQAVEIFSQEAQGASGESGLSDESGLVWKTLSLARTAQALGYWDQAIEWAKRVYQIAPWMPLAQFVLVQCLVEQAEKQRLCDELRIVAHSPGRQVLSDDRYEEFETTVNSIERLLTRFAQQASQGNGGQSALDPSWQQLRCWRSRGRIAFKMDVTALQTLEQTLFESPGGAQGFATLLMGYRGVTDEEKRAATVREIWQKYAHHAEIYAHPLVRLQVALGLSSQAPEEACRVLQEVLEAHQTPLGGYAVEDIYVRACLALCAWRAGAYDLAFRAIQEALSTWPEEPRWHALAAEIYLAMETQGGKKDPSKALIHLEQAIALEPDHAAHFFALGKFYQHIGEPPKARSAFERATELNERFWEAWLALAQLHMQVQEWSRAVMCADKAIEESSGGREALLLRGEIGLRSGDAQSALEHAQAALKLHAEDAQTLHLKARALEALGKVDEALNLLRSVSQSTPHDLSMQMERVRMIRRTQGLEAGLAALQSLASQYEAHPSLLSLLADWLLESGQKEAALQLMRRILQDTRNVISPQERARLHHVIGEQLLETGQYDQAIHHLNEAIFAAPNDLEAYLSLGKAYLQQREHQHALKVFRNAIAIAADDYRPYYYAGLTLKENKEYVEAEVMLRQAAQLAPHEVGVHRLLAAVVALNLVHSRKIEPSEAKS